jgi:rhomboid family GlyGly-CTERM serine protease
MQRGPWVTVAIVLACAAIALTPGAAERLQYERAAVASGELWRLVTGQLAHWTPRMAAADLLVVGIAGAWLEWRSRRLLVWTVAMAGAGVGLTIQAFTPHLASYRGSSGIASGLYAAVAGALIAERAPRWIRLAACLALLGLVGKTALEMATGDAIFAGPLPPGVSAVPEAHLAGALAGIFGSLGEAARRSGRVLSSPRGAPPPRGS